MKLSPVHVPCSNFTETDLLFNLCRFKEHVQSNHPKHFLSEEEFVQLRQELSKASLAQMGGDQDETAVQEELPPGTEDLSDPAKVKIFPTGDSNFLNELLAGIIRSLSLVFSPPKEHFLGS